jgi:hypothetical protein
MTLDKIDQLAKLANIDLEHHVSIGREPVWMATPDELAAFAALVLEEAARVCDDIAMHCETKAEEAIENGEHDEVSVIRSTAWQILTCGQAIRAMKP